MDPSGILSQLAARSPEAGVCCILIYVVIKLFGMYDAEKSQRIKDAQTYADLVSKKDKEVQAEKDARIKDAQALAQIHSESTKESYKYGEDFEDMTNAVMKLHDLIIERMRAAAEKDRLDQALQERTREPPPQFPHRPRPRAKSNDDESR